MGTLSFYTQPFFKTNQTKMMLLACFLGTAVSAAKRLPDSYCTSCGKGMDVDHAFICLDKFHWTGKAATGLSKICHDCSFTGAAEPALVQYMRSIPIVEGNGLRSICKCCVQAWRRRDPKKSKQINAPCKSYTKAGDAKALREINSIKDGIAVLHEKLSEIPGYKRDKN